MYTWSMKVNRRGRMNECEFESVGLGHGNPALAPRPSLIYCASPFD
jgi:hypothetical protein